MNIRIAADGEREAVFALRMEVFVDEQGVSPEIELDAEDARAIHILAEEEGVVLGCARILLHGKDAHLGRIAVKKAYRDRGIGSAVVRFAIGLCRERGCTHIGLGAQMHAVGFYESLGFRPYGQPFEEAGILHIAMAMDAEEEPTGEGI